MIIYPPNDDSSDQHLTVFLAGPIQGADDWQKIAADRLDSSTRIIANPRSLEWHHQYDAQVEWETRKLDQAARTGLLFFWCAKPSIHFCDRPHGQTTRFELGEWFSRYVSGAALLVIGIEEGFSNERYIRKRFRMVDPKKEIPATLEDTLTLANSILISLEKTRK